MGQIQSRMAHKVSSQLPQNTGRRNPQAPKAHTGVPRTRRGERHHQSSAQPEGEAADAGAVAGRSSCVRGARPRSAGPVARHVQSYSQGTFRQGRQVEACASASGTARGTRQRVAYGDISQGRIVEAHPATAWRWVQTAVKRAEELRAIESGKRGGTHTLRHSYARHLLMNGIPINYLSRWLGHSSIQTTLIYLELVPDPTRSLTMVP